MKQQLFGANSLQQNLLISMTVLIFLLTIPLNLDRSISVWLLANQSKNVELSDNDYQKLAIEFFQSSDAETKRRIAEQVSLGTIQRNPEGNFQITSKGLHLISFFQFIAKIFHLDPKYTQGT
jgi:hypothetical protein